MGDARCTGNRACHQSSSGNRDYDICLIDWKMHDIDGIEVTRRIRAEVGYDVPIVMISAYDYMEMEEEARSDRCRWISSKAVVSYGSL